LFFRHFQTPSLNLKKLTEEELSMYLYQVLTVQFHTRRKNNPNQIIEQCDDVVMMVVVLVVLVLVMVVYDVLMLDYLAYPLCFDLNKE
jgi:lipopolysaccharide/colanic/teichoic acid biosynthesis glycosyltransferase